MVFNEVQENLKLYLFNALMDLVAALYTINAFGILVAKLGYAGLI
jgi:hypothetical protein